MSYLKPIRPDEARGAAKELIDGLREKRKPVPRLFLELGRRPGVLAGRQAVRAAVYEGASSLGRRREEMLFFYAAAHGG